MKKILLKIITIILCFSLIFVFPINSFAGLSLEEITHTIKHNEFYKNNIKTPFDKFVNYLIHVINFGIVAVKYPWKPKSNTVDMSKFALVFDEEFDGNSLNFNLWNAHDCDGVRKGGYWDINQAVVKDGHLTIRTEYLENGKYGPGYYTANVSTRNIYTQKYGYFECRCKLAAMEGMWSAFWITTEDIKDFMPGTQGTEIDVMEAPMYWRVKQGLTNNLITSNLHYGGYSLGHRYKNVTIQEVNDPYNTFNTYGVEWNEDGYIYYINGKETGRSNFGGVSKIPEFLRVSCEVDGVGAVPTKGWSGIITNNPKDACGEFVIDYIRAYQYKTKIDLN